MYMIIDSPQLALIRPNDLLHTYSYFTYDLNLLGPQFIWISVTQLISPLLRQLN